MQHHTFLRFKEFARPPPKGYFRFTIEEVLTGYLADSFTFTTSSYVCSICSGSPSSGALVASIISQSSSLQSSISSCSLLELAFLTTGSTTYWGVLRFKLNLSTELFFMTDAVVVFAAAAGFVSGYLSCFGF